MLDVPLPERNGHHHANFGQAVKIVQAGSQKGGLNTHTHTHPGCLGDTNPYCLQLVQRYLANTFHCHEKPSFAFETSRLWNRILDGDLPWMGENRRAP